MIQSKDPQPTLLFIPDISGFTNFVNETEISHSRHIIEELLEILIDANALDLTVSEIEGDAILYYREGQAPSTEELLAQVEKMYVDFHAHLKLYESQRICQCGACSTAHTLSLKFIAHYGEVAKNRIKNFSKLFGREVIAVHRLLKNSIPLGEYLLVTDSLQQAVQDAEDAGHAWAEPIHQKDDYDFGEVVYRYFTLAPLAKRIPEPAVQDYALPGLTTRVMEQALIIEAPIDLVFNVVSDLSYRHHWQEGLKDSIDLNGEVFHQGSTHRCVIKGNDSDPFFVSHDFKRNQDEITFTDTNQKDKFSNVFQLEKLEASRSRLTIFTFIQKNPFKEFLFRWVFKRRLEQTIHRSMQRLKAYCQELVSTGQNHSAQILLAPASEIDENRACCQPIAS